MAAPTASQVPAEISEAAALATGLVTRTLKLLERSITKSENSPEPPSIKECESYVATVKRAADTLKSLASLTRQPSHATARSTPSKPLPEPSATPSTNTTRQAAAAKETEDILSMLTSMESSLAGMLPKGPPAALRTHKPPQPATTRRYGEMLSRR